MRENAKIGRVKHLTPSTSKNAKISINLEILWHMSYHCLHVHM